MYILKKLNMIGGSDDFDINKKLDDIYQFMKTLSKDNFDKLFDLLNHDQYCLKILGEGYFGKVFEPELNKTFPYRIKDKTINLPIVVKESKHNDNPNIVFDSKMIDDTLYIYGNETIMTEALILIYIRKLFSKTVHLPLILGYGICDDKKMINKIITLKHGLDYEYELDISDRLFDEFEMTGAPIRQIFKSKIATLTDLIQYINLNIEDDGTIILPNKIKCNVVELYDYLCISYLVTYHLLTKNDICPFDLHASNIFIHWLNDKSYYGSKNIKNTEEIVYKIFGKYYKIKTFGFVIILGDLGNSIIKIKKDVILVGQSHDIEKRYKMIQSFMNFKVWNVGFFWIMHVHLSLSNFEKTIAFKIMKTYPYNNYSAIDITMYKKYDIQYLKNLKTTKELLSFYDEKYSVKNYNKSESKNCILIKIKKYLK